MVFNITVQTGFWKRKHKILDGRPYFHESGLDHVAHNAALITRFRRWSVTKKTNPACDRNHFTDCEQNTTFALTQISARPMVFHEALPKSEAMANAA